jgi:hypothetical protein
LPRQFQADISSATATLRQPQLSGPPSIAKRQSAHYKTTVPILRTATKPNAAVIIHPSSLFETERSGHAPALNPHRPTPLPAQTPPRFPPSRLFGRLPPCIPSRCLNREEFVVVGWSDPEGTRHRIGALLLAYHTDDGKLI